MSQMVNLDALIPREDFEVVDERRQSQASQTISIRDLEKDAFFYAVIRKPDFQRETNEWDARKIFDFVQSFLDGDLIPALILWQSGSYIFVIDGSHRLSALISWVHDDYGDGQISREFFDGIIPAEQKEVANQTRALIRKKIGSYEEHKFAIRNPEKSPPELVERAKRMASLAIQLQWVKGDAEIAEASFFRINQQAAPINKTEIRLLKSRKKPNAVAARAIIRSGTGHKYWSKFGEERACEIEQSARDINSLLFTPALKTPIKTLDLPVAGKGYSSQTLPLVLDFVNRVNDVKADADLADDLDGETTLRFLKNCHRIVNRMSGLHPSSLGLHPVVYFYSLSGKYQTTCFLAMVGIVKELERTGGFGAFVEARNRFEEFLLRYKVLTTQVVWRSGSGSKGAGRMQMLFHAILSGIWAKKLDEEILRSLTSNPMFSYLQPRESDEPTRRTDFDTDTKSEAFLREALSSPLRCKICGSMIHYNSISIDHIVRKADGGLGTVENAQLTHPYCNSTVKN